MDDVTLGIIIIVAILIGLGRVFLKLWLTPERLGGLGENIVADKLLSLAHHNNEYKIFNSAILKTPDGTTQVDHIVISPYKVFVIETKNFKGWIFGGERQKSWTQSLKGRRYMGLYWNQKYQIKNPLHQNYKHVAAVQSLLGINPNLIANVVVFVGDSVFMTEMPDNVLELQGLIPYIKRYENRIFDFEKIEMFSAKLAHHIEEMSRLAQGTTQHIKNIEQNRGQPICPRCGKYMVVRTAKKGIAEGSMFWGCSGFPHCKSTKRIARY